MKNKIEKGYEDLILSKYGHEEELEENSYTWKVDFYRASRESETTSSSKGFESKKELLNHVKKWINYETNLDKCKKGISIFFWKIGCKFR